MGSPCGRTSRRKARPSSAMRRCAGMPDSNRCPRARLHRRLASPAASSALWLCLVGVGVCVGVWVCVGVCVCGCYVCVLCVVGWMGVCACAVPVCRCLPVCLCLTPFRAAQAATTRALGQPRPRCVPHRRTVTVSCCPWCHRHVVAGSPSEQQIQVCACGAIPRPERRRLHVLPQCRGDSVHSWSRRPPAAVHHGQASAQRLQELWRRPPAVTNLWRERVRPAAYGGGEDPWPR